MSRVFHSLLFCILLTLLSGVDALSSESLDLPPTLKVGNNHRWMFTPHGKDRSVPIKVGMDLGPQLSEFFTCCSGEYSVDIDRSVVERFVNNDRNLGAIYIPAIGGKVQLYIDDKLE